ncbi:MAG: S8 family serine peptidase [Alphaproteobacteria bacterium]|nr:S8 family serine peptidase [Alphaproteobacteria bacterium]
MNIDYQSRRHLFRRLLASTALATLAACSSSDDDGGGNEFRTQEFRSSSGLDQIRASQGYAQVTGPQGGEGVTIAILDDGVDENHPDLAPNLAGSFVFGGAADVDSQHGTAVAGIAAGDDGNGGIQGVAFNADILAFQVGDQNPNNPNEIVFDSDTIASGLDEASARGADVINMSLSFPASGTLRLSDGTIVGRTPSTGAETIEDAMRTAAGRGALMVVAAGNDNNDLDFVEDVNGLSRGSVVEIGANFPALSVTESGLGNAVIVAVAVDDDNDIADFSNTCLGVETRCIAAPGVNFRGALPGGGVGNIGSGTSYSAPLVTGAAAVVQAAFPGTSPQEAGNRLLSTATDLGPSGTDSTFGRGLLNLENALTPQGQLAVATSNRLDGSRTPLAGSGFSLGSSLAFGGAGADLLADAIALDSDNFPFGVDLSGAAKPQSRSTGLSSFIASSDRRVVVVASDDIQATLSLAEDPWLDDPYRARFAPSDTSLRKEETTSPRLEMRSELADGVDFFFGLNGSSVTEAGVTKRLPEAGGLFQPTAFLAPYDQLAGEQSGGGTSIALGDQTDLLLSTFVSTDTDSGREASMQKIELAHRTFADLELRLGYGFMNEAGGFLGGEASGAFGEDSGGNSHYVDLSLLAPITEDLKLFGAYTYGLTDASGGSGLITEVSTLRSSAFGVGLALADVAGEGDCLTFMIGQPLRVSEGSAEVTVPTGRTPDGEVIRESGALDLTPSGREIAFEASYDFGLADDDHDLAIGVFLRLNPDHDPDAEPDAGIGLKYKLTF